MRDYIDAAAFKEMVLCADAALHKNIQPINELNVFPVPDGDTGTNMGLTINSAAIELRKRDFQSVDAVADCVASAMLRGARGNSGVILSLLFRGIAKRLKGIETAGTVEFTGAMQDGVDAAYKAVMKPAEGTILTVSRLASGAAVDAASEGESLENALLRAISAGDEALQNTMNMNPVLKKAGVIDAGGKGYMVILNAMLASLRGEINSADMASGSEDDKASDGWGDGQVDIPTENVFDTVYVVRKFTSDEDLSPLREYLDSIGDSIVISEDDEIFKVHVHTDIPGQVLTESQKFGVLELAKIENMRSQAEAVVAGRKAQSTDDLEQIEQELEAMEEKGMSGVDVEPEKEYGVVTVCAGAGLEALFKELGADHIVTGGQTMNPSTNDILREIQRTPASTVFVLPNNKNIVMAAQQCEPLTDKKVVVIPTKTVPQGISALLCFDPEAQEQELVDAMNEARKRVHTAMITYAARDSDFDGHDIHAGEYLALLDGALVGSYPNQETLFDELCEKCASLSPEFITLYYGADVKEEDAAIASEHITAKLPDADISVVDGGQPVYYYMLSLE